MEIGGRLAFVLAITLDKGFLLAESERVLDPTAIESRLSDPFVPRSDMTWELEL